MLEIVHTIEITLDEEKLRQLVIDQVARQDPSITVSEVNFVQRRSPTTAIEVTVKGHVEQIGVAPVKAEAVVEVEEAPEKPKAKKAKKSVEEKPVEEQLELTESEEEVQEEPVAEEPADDFPEDAPGEDPASKLIESGDFDEEDPFGEDADLDTAQAKSDAGVDSEEEEDPFL